MSGGERRVVINGYTFRDVTYCTHTGNTINYSQAIELTKAWDEIDRIKRTASS